MKNALSNALLGQETNSSRNEFICFTLATFVVWSYLLLRSIYIPLVHDEAVTFEAYMQLGKFLPPNAYWDANNHLLNSAVGSFFYQLFGFSWLTIRLWNLLTFGVYAAYIFSIGSLKINYKPYKWLFFGAALCTPFAIEFFSLARGYGGSLAFFVASIYYALKTTENPTKQKHFFLFVSTAVVSVMCNFSIIIGVFVVSTFVFLKWLAQGSLSFSKLLLRASVLLVSMLPWAIWILELKSRGLLYYGGKDIFQHFLNPMGRLYLNEDGLGVLMLIPFGWSLIIILQNALKSGLRAVFNKNLIFSFSSILGLILIVFLQLTFNVNYPEDRAALYFFPFMIGSFTETIATNKKWLTAPFVLFLLWPTYDLISTANITHNRHWFREHVSKDVYKTLAPTNGITPTVSGFGLREINWQYGIFNQAVQPVISSEGFPSKWTDYLYSTDRFKNEHPTGQYDTVLNDKITGQYLLKRKSPLKYEIISDTIISSLITSNQFINIFDYSDSLVPNAPLKLELTISANPSAKNVPVTIIASAIDTSFDEIYYEKHNLLWSSDKLGELNKLVIAQVLPTLDKSAKRLVIYLYNPFEVDYHFQEVSAKLEIISEKQNSPNN